MASLGARCLSWPSQHSISQQRQPIPTAARALRPGPSLYRAVHRHVCCHAAASDQKNASEPMSLRDLIMFEVCTPWDLVGICSVVDSCLTFFGLTNVS
jgi:hypothetical protein